VTGKRLALAIGSIVAVAAACAGPGAAPPLTMRATTLTTGWEQHFTIEWSASPGANGARRLTGYVHNKHGELVTQMRVLGQALDQSGAVVAQRIAFVPGGVGGFGRAYFEVPNLPAANGYRVSVWDYTWNQADGDRQ
jgi:hypothetical protein